MDVLFGERQNVTPSCIMMTGAPLVLNNIDRDGIILAENGAFLHADCDEYEYEEEVQEGVMMMKRAAATMSLLPRTSS